MAFLCIPLTLGVWIRIIVPNFYAADIGFETVIILGILLGPFSALLGGAVLSVPALIHHEYLTLPFFLAVAAVSGLYGRAVEPEEVWSFSPLWTSAFIAGFGAICWSRGSIARCCC